VIDLNTLLAGFGFILIAAVAGGAFGLQYRVMRRYTVENSSLLSLFVATVVVPLVAIQFLLPGWTTAIQAAGWKTNLLVFGFGFGWGLGCITYAYGFNMLGMALAASLLKGISVAVGAGVPLVRRWHEVSGMAKLVIVAGLFILLVGTAVGGQAGILRERELRGAKGSPRDDKPGSRTATGRLFVIGLGCCLLSGLLSACANLGYDFADPLEAAMGSHLAWKATLIRWMPMYWGGIVALIICMGGAMLRNGAWRNYFAPDSGRDFCVSSSMGLVHFLAQIPYGIGAYYLGTLGTSAGWGVFIGMALVVASLLGFAQGEWKGISRRAVNVLLVGVAVLIVGMAVLAYANTLVPPKEAQLISSPADPADI
jgi:L-rhamnose-H+ transport protein